MLAMTKIISKIGVGLTHKTWYNISMKKNFNQTASLLTYSAQSVDVVAQEFGADTTGGLTTQRAQTLLTQEGRNEIQHRRTRVTEILWRQLASPFIYLLFAAALLSIGLREVLEGSMILLFIAINTGIGFFQEYQSEKILAALNHFVAQRAKVIRNGEITIIDAAVVVPGDTIVLETGDRIPADVRFSNCVNVVVDESILTGESIPVPKDADALTHPADQLYQARNLGFAGTTVVSGGAHGIVVATGEHSSVGSIVRLTLDTNHESDFAHGIGRFSTFILKLVSVTLVIVFLVNLIIKGEGADIIELLIFSIALAVSVIPEALPVVTTFSLARGARQLARHHVVVKRLSAIEDLGGVEVLCTDKTGTLTENKLTLTGSSPNAHAETLRYANLAAAKVNKNRIEPFDIAVDAALTANERKTLETFTRIADVPFDPARRRNATLLQHGKTTELVVRGAAELIISNCNNLNDGARHALDAWIKEEGRAGHRILAIARKTTSQKKLPTDGIELEKIERDMEFLGALAFTDPLKKSSIKAAQQATKLGVEIKIITGDSREVAGAIAHQMGLISSPDAVITGTELDALSSEERDRAIGHHQVFARIPPEMKHLIIETLERTRRVGFLGEGINDAPALKVAGVSLVVDSAADIAREAADIILLRKDLTVILDGIREGRIVFLNTAKYIRATLASNFGNFYAVAIASLFIDYLPMLPLQILLLNLLSDFPMIAISTDTVDRDEANQPQRYQVRDIIMIATILGIVSSIFDFIIFAFFFRSSPAVLQTNWFIASILTELVFLFSIRTKKFFIASRPPSAILFWLSISAMVVTVILPLTTLGHRFFNFVTPHPMHLVLIFAVVGVYFICTETTKLAYYTFIKKSNS